MEFKSSEVKKAVNNTFQPFFVGEEQVFYFVLGVLGRLGISVVKDPPLPKGPLVENNGWAVSVTGEALAVPTTQPSASAFISWAVKSYNEERPWVK